MRFESFVAFRYLRGKRKNRFVSLITLISVAGVAVGVMALIVVMSVMTGFDNALRATIIGNLAHLEVREWFEPMLAPDAIMSEIERLSPEVVACAPFIQAEALLERPVQGRRGSETPALIMGVDPELESEVTQLAENLTREGGRTRSAGELPGLKEIVLGYGVAQNLGVGVGSDIKAYTTRERADAFVGKAPRPIYLRVSGIAQAKDTQFDSYYAFVDLETARMLTGRTGVDGIHCKLTDPFKAEGVARTLEENLDVQTVTWRESRQSFFEALKQEKVVMFIILVFIILVAAFNITSTLIMVVMEKRRDIGILRTIGASGPSILRLFILEGLFIGLAGTVAGVVCGTLLAYNLNPVAEFVAKLLNVDIFSSEIYYFDHIPVAVVWSDVVWITVCAVVLTFVSTLYPAWSASRLDPVEALRYE